MRDINIFETEMFPFLEGEEVKDKPVTLTVADIRHETMKSHRGKDENKEVLYFKETKKGFVLNKTNAKRIAMMYGPQTGQWEGKKITLTTEPVQAFGELHNALRVSLAAVDTSRDMSLEKLLILLNKVEGIEGFYNSPVEIYDCRRDGASLPAPDDIEGWRVLFTDARDYALEERIQMQADAFDDTTTPGQYFGEKDYGPNPPNFAGPMPQATAIEPAQSAMDQVEAEDAAQPPLLTDDDDERDAVADDDPYNQTFEN